MSFGSRFSDGGYQNPATNAAALERGRPVRSLEWTIGDERITLRLVPLLHGRPELFELEYQRDDPVKRWSCYTPCVVRGEKYAREAFAQTAGELDAGRIPELVLVSPGTPLGP